MSKNAFKLSTMVGEYFEIYFSQMSKNAFKLSIMVGENFEIYFTEMAKNSFKLANSEERVLFIHEIVIKLMFFAFLRKAT